VLDLLAGLRDDLGLTLVFVSHDLAVVRQVCGRVAVMRHGRFVELAPTDEAFDGPSRPSTRELLDAVPTLAPLTNR